MIFFAEIITVIFAIMLFSFIFKTQTNEYTLIATGILFSMFVVINCTNAILKKLIDIINKLN